MVAGFIYSEGRALVSLRALSKSTAPGQLHLPGGHVEVGEYPVAALYREIEEEFGVQVQAGEPLHVFEYVENQHRTFGIVYAVHLEVPRTALRPDPLDNSEILWVGREELDQLFPDKNNHNYLAAVEGFAYI
ncbi:MAG: NUDIX domain-containing protein [Gammaproteobacteria bacterium]|nr:NUDIX domain-containing protein [Gammaproteobacteria bacterium]MBU1979169.1 NUDIX domain-containing protein [Gammaproteobacteria bacterium]